MCDFNISFYLCDSDVFGFDIKRDHVNIPNEKTIEKSRERKSLEVCFDISFDDMDLKPTLMDMDTLETKLKSPVSMGIFSHIT